MLISICMFSYLFIMPVIFNVRYPQIFLIYVPFVEYIIQSTNIMTPYSLSLFLAHDREKSVLELSFLEIIFIFLQSFIHKLKD